MLADALKKTEQAQEISQAEAMLYVWNNNQDWFECLKILGFKCGELQGCQGKVTVVVPKWSPVQLAKKAEKGTSGYLIFSKHDSTDREYSGGGGKEEGRYEESI